MRTFKMVRHKKIFSLIAIILLISVDQIVKYIIRHSGGFYICNKGIAFGLSPLTSFVIILGLLLFLFLSNFKFKIFNLKLISNFKFQISNWSNIQLLSAILIVSGGLSNIIDRFAFGCVIDFIDLKFWPVFNLADVHITLGGIIILYKIIKQF